MRALEARRLIRLAVLLAAVHVCLPAPAARGCLFCHAEIGNATANMGDFEVPCALCHGGDSRATTKEEAHVHPELPVIADKTTPPLDYDLAYQQFVNPSNLRVVHNTCGVCHPTQVEDILKSMMATTAGHFAGGLYQNDVVDTKTPIYANFAVADEDGDVPTERGAVESLLPLLTYDPTADPKLFSTHYAAVPGQACARCHLWSRGKGYRGAEGADGVYRADGCAACHMPYADDGRSQSSDASIDHVEQGHPIGHVVTRKIPTSQCLHCHHRGARIGLSYTGRAQMPPGLPSGPGVAGTTDVRFNGNYHYADSTTNPPDIHHEKGLHCIDCHTQAGVMGDGNIYGHMDQATKTECRTCHGMPDSPAALNDHDGIPLNNVRADGDGVLLTSKVTGRSHEITQIMDLVDPESSRYSPEAASAMTAFHVKEKGGLECYACHSAWVNNCFGCHFERDERRMGQNLITGEWEVGKVATDNKIFEAFRHFSLAPNSEGRTAPYIVSCHPIADVTLPDGKILDFVMPVTSNGLSGLAHNPVQPHTVRGRGEVRSCVECHRSPPSLGLGSGNYSIARTYAYLTTASGVMLFDRWTDPARPRLAATLQAGTPRAVASLSDVVEGTTTYLYVASGERGVSIFDMTGGIPGGPVATIEGVDAIDVSRAARYLHVVVAGLGVNIYDNADPRLADLVATVRIPTALRAVEWGIHLFVPAGEAGLFVVDVSDHGAPVIIGSLTGINAVDVRLYAHFQDGADFAVRAYVADPEYGVHVIDLLPEAASLTRVGGLPLPGAVGLDTYTRYVPAEGDTPSREHDYLYVAAGTNGLHIYDITDPDTIAAAAALHLGGNVVDVDVTSQLAPPGVDDYALIANEDRGLQVVDVNDPRTPVMLSRLSVPGAGRLFVDVQQMDRFIDEQGNVLKENSHPFIEPYGRDDLVRILKAPLEKTVLPARGRLLIRNVLPDDARRNKGIWVARSRSIVAGVAGSTDDPRCNGAPPGTVRASIRFSSDGSAGSVADSGEIPLPCQNWTLIAGNKGFEYEDRRREDGPCKRILLREGKHVKAACFGGGASADFLYDLTEGTDEGTVNAVLRTGLMRTCMAFDGASGSDGRNGKRFRGRTSSPSEACP